MVESSESESVALSESELESYRRGRGRGRWPWRRWWWWWWPAAPPAPPLPSSSDPDRDDEGDEAGGCRTIWERPPPPPPGGGGRAWKMSLGLIRPLSAPPLLPLLPQSLGTLEEAAAVEGALSSWNLERKEKMERNGGCEGRGRGKLGSKKGTGHAPKAKAK